MSYITSCSTVSGILFTVAIAIGEWRGIPSVVCINLVENGV